MAVHKLMDRYTRETAYSCESCSKALEVEERHFFARSTTTRTQTLCATCYARAIAFQKVVGITVGIALVVVLGIIVVSSIF